MIAWLKTFAISLVLRRLGAPPEAASTLAPRGLHLLEQLVAFFKDLKAAGKSDEEAATEAEAKVWRDNDPDRPNTADDIYHPRDNV